MVAPFGYGEIAPRDLESCMIGAVLIKPDMGHLDTIPNIYDPMQTYVPCKWDFSDLNEKIDYVLSDYKNLQSFFVENMRKRFIQDYNQEKLVLHTHNWLSKLEGFGFE